MVPSVLKLSAKMVSVCPRKSLRSAPAPRSQTFTRLSSPTNTHPGGLDKSKHHANWEHCGGRVWNSCLFLMAAQDHICWPAQTL